MAALVLVVAVGYRTYLNEEAGTGDLTLPQPAPNVGEPAPEFTATTVSGEEFTLSEEGTYVLAFRSALNRASERARPGFAEVVRDFEGSRVSFAAVYLSGVPRMEGHSYTMIRDSSGELASSYNVKRVPRLFVVQDGRVELVLNGYYPENDEFLRDELAEILNRQTAGSSSS